MRSRSDLGTALFALGALLISLSGAELALRAYEHASAPPDLRALHRPLPDREWLYGLRPGAEVVLDEPREVVYRINADGFRGPLYERAKPHGAFRIAVLGDSLAFGYGVSADDTFSSRLERRLRRGTPASDPNVPHFQVLNLGVNGYNAYNEAALFRGLGGRYQPDLVLVQFCINDLNDPTLHFDASTQLALGSLPEAAFPNPGARSVPTQPGLCGRLRLCARISSLLGDGPEQIRNRVWAAALSPRDEPQHTAEWSWLRRRYREIARTSGELGAGFGVVVFPYQSQVEGNRRAYAQRALRRMAEEEGWAIVDLLPAFRRAARAGRRLFLDAWHPTPAGHAVAAAAIERKLLQGEMLPLHGGGRASARLEGEDEGP